MKALVCLFLLATIAYSTTLTGECDPYGSSSTGNTCNTNIYINKADGFLDAIKQRRSIYAIDKNVKISDERIQEIVETVVLHIPSAFNSQTGRVKILLGKESDKFWMETKEILRNIVPADQFAATETRINGFGAGYGTVLFFEDQNDVKGLQDNFPTYAPHFPFWSEHSSGMLQFAIWTALELEGLGASLQHYAPLVDNLVQEQWNVPKNWKLISQMPFGNPTAPVREKTFKPIQQRVQVHK